MQHHSQEEVLESCTWQQKFTCSKPQHPDSSKHRKDTDLVHSLLCSNSLSNFHRKVEHLSGPHHKCTHRMANLCCTKTFQLPSLQLLPKIIFKVSQIQLLSRHILLQLNKLLTRHQWYPPSC